MFQIAILIALKSKIQLVIGKYACFRQKNVEFKMVLLLFIFILFDEKPKLIANKMNVFVSLELWVAYGRNNLYRCRKTHITHARWAVGGMWNFQRKSISIRLLKFTFFRRKANKQKILHYKCMIANASQWNGLKKTIMKGWTIIKCR